MGYDPNDPKQVKKAKDDAELADALKKSVIKDVMKTPAGRAWIYSWLERCHIYGNTLVAGQTDVTFFNIGEENIGKQLLADVQSSAPELYLRMIREAKS